MNAAQSHESIGTQPNPVQIGNLDAIVIPCDYIGDFSLSSDENGDLTSDIVRNGAQLTGQLLGDDFMGIHPSAIQFLQKVVLAGFKTGYFSIYFFDGFKPRMKVQWSVVSEQ